MPDARMGPGSTGASLDEIPPNCAPPGFFVAFVKPATASTIAPKGTYIVAKSDVSGSLLIGYLRSRTAVNTQISLSVAGGPNAEQTALFSPSARVIACTLMGNENLGAPTTFVENHKPNEPFVPSSTAGPVGPGCTSGCGSGSGSGDRGVPTVAANNDEVIAAYNKKSEEERAAHPQGMPGEIGNDGQGTYQRDGGYADLHKNDIYEDTEKGQVSEAEIAKKCKVVGINRAWYYAAGAVAAFGVYKLSQSPVSVDYAWPVGGACAGFFAGSLAYDAAFAESSKCGCSVADTSSDIVGAVFKAAGAIVGAYAGMVADDVLAGGTFSIDPDVLIKFAELGLLGVVIYLVYQIQQSGGLVVGTVSTVFSSIKGVFTSAYCGVANMTSTCLTPEQTEKACLVKEHQANDDRRSVIKASNEKLRLKYAGADTLIGADMHADDHH